MIYLKIIVTALVSKAIQLEVQSIKLGQNETNENIQPKKLRDKFGGKKWRKNFLRNKNFYVEKN